MPGQEQEPPDRLPPLPEGVSAASVFPGGKAIYHRYPFPRTGMWEGLTINSMSFRQLPPQERFYRLSCAYLHGGIVLCERAGDSGSQLEWPAASVCYYCLNLATELFYKACILCVGHEPERSHEISKLQRRYEELLPGEEYKFHALWAQSAENVNDVVGFELFRGVDRKPDQLFRYSMDKNGTPSAGIHFFTPGVFFDYAKYLGTRWSEIWARISSKVDC
jgi:hypothetical protein